MPTLYYTPTSCGAASFIAAHTAKIEDLNVEVVDLATHKTSKGQARRATLLRGSAALLLRAQR
jgi:hypothetical protein